MEILVIVYYYLHRDNDISVFHNVVGCKKKKIHDASFIK